MGCIIVGIILGVLIIAAGLYLFLDLFNCAPLAFFFYLVGYIIIISSFILGVFAPISGYKEAKIHSSIELVSLEDNTVSKGRGGMFYVSISGENAYTYYAETDSEYKTATSKSYKSYTVSGNNVTIIEDESYTDAKLVTYVKKPKKTFWTFAIFGKKYEYVFYVPTGTIRGNVSLG